MTDDTKISPSSTHSAGATTFHVNRLTETLKALWDVETIDAHMCSGEVRIGQLTVLKYLREDIAYVLAACGAQSTMNELKPVAWAYSFKGKSPVLTDEKKDWAAGNRKWTEEPIVTLSSAQSAITEARTKALEEAASSVDALRALKEQTSD